MYRAQLAAQGVAGSGHLLCAHGCIVLLYCMYVLLRVAGCACGRTCLPPALPSAAEYLSDSEAASYLLTCLQYLGYQRGGEIVHHWITSLISVTRCAISAYLSSYRVHRQRTPRHADWVHVPGHAPMELELELKLGRPHARPTFPCVYTASSGFFFFIFPFVSTEIAPPPPSPSPRTSMPMPLLDAIPTGTCQSTWNLPMARPQVELNRASQV